MSVYPIIFWFISLKTQGEQHSLQFTFTCCKCVVRYAGVVLFVVSQFNNQAGLWVSAVICDTSVQNRSTDLFRDNNCSFRICHLETINIYNKTSQMIFTCWWWQMSCQGTKDFKIDHLGKRRPVQNFEPVH